MTQHERALGVCYYPEHWLEEMWADDAARMAEAGISVVRIAEFSWSRLEPKSGELEFGWLDRAIDTLTAAGLRVVMCTPTATPPKWLIDKMPDMVAIDHDGKPRGFGSRRHYCFSHTGYRRECARITEILAKRYGKNPNIIAWQTDNEFGCHNTTISFSDAALIGFRDWLSQKYQAPDALNRAWGNVFWSMEVADFSEVELPNLTVTEANPAHWLDFRRYASDQVAAFNRVQTDILRRHAPGHDIIHNFMGRYLEFDHFDVSADLDIASWDSYPIGFLEQFGRDNAWKNWYMRAGDPDFQAFHHDLYRACGAKRSGSSAADGRWWVMEQQPGPVNWAPYNPDPHPGMVRLWSHEAFAHGAEVVSYFRWRQPPFAQEQMHTALNRSDNTPDRALSEASQVAEEIGKLPRPETRQEKVALVFDYKSIWAAEIQPQGASYDAFALTFAFYRSLRMLGQSIDILQPGMPLEGYKAVFVPQSLIVTEDFLKQLQNCNAQVLFGPRSGSRTEDHQIPRSLPPGKLQRVLPMRVERVESMRPEQTIESADGGSFTRWFEQCEPGENTEVLLASKDDAPMILRHENYTYVAGWPDDALIEKIVTRQLRDARVAVCETGDDLRLRDHGALRTIINYGPKPQDAGHLIGNGDKILIGCAVLPVAGVTILQRGAS